MNRVLLLFLLLTIAACSPPPQNAPSGGSLQPTPTTGSPPAAATPNAPPGTATVPGGETITRATTTPAATAAASSPVTPSTVGWRTFTSPPLDVVLEYPPDWTASVQGTGAVFTSPQGATIALDLVNTGALSPADYLNQNDLPNTHCSTQTNVHAVTLRICLDTIALAHIAYFVIGSSPGPQHLLSLASGRRGSLQVFNAMLGTVRPLS